MSSEDTIESAAAGISKGVLEFTVDQLKILAKRFSNRDISFIEDEPTIRLIKDQRRSSEWDLYGKYVKDHEMRLLIQMGLALRRLETDPSSLQNLRDKIVRKFGVRGLHISELVQNQALAPFISVSVSRISSPADITQAIEQLLKNVDRYCIFIKESDDSEKKVEDIRMRLMGSLPETMIILASKSAKSNAGSIAETLRILVESEYEITCEEESEKKVFIFIRKSSYRFGR